MKSDCVDEQLHSQRGVFKEPPGKTRFLSPEEEAKILAALGPVYGPSVRLAILTGMR